MGEKEKYQEKVDVQLHEWRGWIDLYKSDLSIRGRGDTTKRQQMIERLNDCQRIAQDRLEELRTSNDIHWELSKQAVERAMIDLKKLLDESGATQTGRSLSLQTSRSYIYEPFTKRG